MSIEDRFYAAVNVINGLPKHGPYQPSNEMKLSFYSYYKQATEGPNCETKPWSWEVAKRAKWDAWKRLGDMSREQAMSKYVEELNKIIETMSYTENVADFLKSMDEVNTVESEKDGSGTSDIEFDKVSASSPVSTKPSDRSPELCASNRDDSIDEDEDEMYTDSVDNTFTNTRVLEIEPTVIANGYVNRESSLEQETTTDILMRTVLTMRTELNEIISSVRRIEQKHKALTRRNGLFKGLSNQTVTFIILWPIATNLILFWLYFRKNLKTPPR